MSERAYFFGCWNRMGHFWFVPGGNYAEHENLLPFARWIDMGYAPRRFKSGRFMRRHLVADPMCCFIMEGTTDDERRRHVDDTEEYEQGRYLIHVKDGWTMISWWDRCQGDVRGACNSNFVLEGVHDSVTMREALFQHFPHVVDNLERTGVPLILVSPVTVLR